MMTIHHLIVKEIIHRKFNFSLSLLAVTVAVGLAVAFFTTGEASKRETIRLMRDMGYNLRIIAKDTDMDLFYATGYSDKTLPIDYVQKFSEQKGLLYAHLLATLQKSIEWRGQRAILTGIAPELSPVGKKKDSMIFEIKPGIVYIGYELAHALAIKNGDSVEIMGKKFTVEKCLSEAGSEDDIRIHANLNDVQNLLQLDGRINEIQALNCHCVLKGVDPLALLREQLAKVLPDTHVIQKRAIADARTNQRILMENYFALILPFILVVCAIWIGTLALMNTRDRKSEIGILRALGYGSWKIAFLFLEKAILIGLIGAFLGFMLGTCIAMTYGAEVFTVTFKKIQPIYNLLVIFIIAAPIFTAVSSFIPAMIAATHDPAESLRED
jgi:putative ABC transport system permease protein